LGLIVLAAAPCRSKNGIELRGQQNAKTDVDEAANGARKRKVDNVIHDLDTNEMVLYKPRKGWFSVRESQLDV
jgi:hypothetical protein